MSRELVEQTWFQELFRKKFSGIFQANAPAQVLSLASLTVILDED